MFYVARWYDPAVGRFLQADTIVPGAGNPQAFNRYSYVLNSPLNYTDPTGHFDEKTQLEVWFGIDWRDKFSSDMQAILLLAQFDDVLYSADRSYKAVFVEGEDGGLKLWDVQARASSDVMEYVNTYTKRDERGLYRFSHTNSQTKEPYFDLQGPSCIGCMNQISLSQDWYVGSYYEQVGPVMTSRYVIDEHDVIGLGFTAVTAYIAKKAGERAIQGAIGGWTGGLIGLTALLVDIHSMIEYESHYKIYRNTPFLPAQPVPVAPTSSPVSPS